MLINRKAVATVALALLLAGVGVAQPDISKPSQLAHVTSLAFVPTPSPTPDYTRLVLQPIHAKQESDNSACEASGGHISGVTCITPPPPTPTPTPTPQPVYVAPALPVNDAKAFIYWHESGNNPAAINPFSGACGLGQALPCSKLPCSLMDYACQDAWFTQYAIERYGSWEAAAAFWQAHLWW